MNSEHINDEGLCYCGSLDCIGHLRVLTESLSKQVAELTEQVDSLRISLDNSRASESRAIDIKNVYQAKKNEIREFIQASIDREEWSTDELAEPFWEELAKIADLNLRRTKEIEIRVTITYSGTVTVPYDCDAASDLDVEHLSNEITVNYGGQEIEDQWVTFEGQEIEEY